ncbi:hypothetical protein [Priestia megaterium]|uniref:hypothetical protein n=1 Tax=Priestia megaterium TaxID=1404 RepID=UPI002E1E53D6|nr:hypothetical protein [Priestia megaterium]
MSFDAKPIFETAANFEAASLTLNEKMRKGANYIETHLAPYVTLNAFSIELYLKCLYAIENDNNAPNVHAWDKLFELLSDESKNEIESIYDNNVKNSNSIQILLKRVPGTNVDLINALQEMSGAFVKWRYVYEGSITGYPTATALIDALKARIKKLKTNW